MRVHISSSLQQTTETSTPVCATLV